MRLIVVFLVMFLSYSVNAQSKLSVFAGTDVYNYSFKNWSDPVFVAGLSNCSISDTWIKEMRIGYQRIAGQNGILMGIYIGKQYNKSSLRVGGKITGLSDNAPTYLHLSGTYMYDITKNLSATMEYSYLPVLGDSHSFGIALLYEIYRD